MRGTISFEQELRASRLASGQKKGTNSDPMPGSRQNERPWQDDIEQVQQTLREVVRVIASFSGVEIPGLPAGVHDDSAPAPKLNINTLKDRLRNDLEGFSLKTTEELAKRAREQTRAALDAIQNEVGGHIEQAAAELRQELQLPAQVDKLLQPCIEESHARLEKSFSEKFEQLTAGQQQLVQESIQTALGHIQAQMGALEQAVQQVRELKSDSAAQATAALNSTIDHQLAEQQRVIQESIQTAVSSLHTQMGALIAAELQNRLQAPAQIEKLLEPCVRQAVARLESSFVPNVEQMLNEQEQSLQENVQRVLNSVHGHMSAVDQKVQQIQEVRADLAARLSAEQPNATFEGLLAEHERSIQGRIQAALSSFQSQIGALEQSLKQVRELKSDSAAQATAELSSKVDHLLADQERSVQNGLQTALSSFQAQIGALDQKVQQIRDEQADLAVRLSTEQPNDRLESQLADQERSIQNRLQTALSSFQSQIGALDQKLEQFRELNAGSVAQISPEQQNAALNDAMEKYEGRLNNELEKVVNLLTERERTIQARLQTALNSVQAQIGALDRKLEQIRELKAGSVAQISPEQPAAVVDSAMKQAEISLNNGIKEFLDRSFSRIEGSFNSLMETPKFRAVQSTHTKLESLRKAIPNGSTDMLIRVQQALDNLDRLGSKDPLPPS